MKRWTGAAFLIAVSFHNFAGAADNFEAAFVRCQNFSGTEVTVQMSPEKQRQTIEANKVAKTKACAEAQAIVTGRNDGYTKISTFLNGPQARQVLDHVAHLNQVVDSESANIISSVKELEQVTSEISPANNSKFIALKSRLAESKAKLLDWSANWRELHLSPKEAPLAEIESLKTNPALDEMTRVKLQNYLGRLPAYLFGVQDPPRERIERLRNSILSTEDAMEIRYRFYVSAFYNAAVGQINTAIDPKLLKQKAKLYYLKARYAGDISDPMPKALAAQLEGACFSSRSEYEFALERIAAIRDSAPAALKNEIEILASTEETRLRERLAKLSTCETQANFPLLKKSIQNLLRVKCSKSNERINRIHQESELNFNAMNGLSETKVSRNQIVVGLHLEKIWRDLKLAEAGCKNGAIP